ncbi:MAG TPA: hypothetical protein VGI00_04305, partial [Streptosporangiaceae bacterium]
MVVVALADDARDGDCARARLRGAIDAGRAALALDDLATLPLERAPHRPLISRCWQLRAGQGHG